MRRLRKEIQQFKPDVVHAHFGTLTALVCVLVSPVPVVITFHGQDLNPSPGDPWLRSKLGHLFSHLAARRAAQIICVSPGVRNHVGYIKDRVHLLPCGINMERFHPMPKDECRAKLGWRMDDKIVVFNAGSDPVRKRIDVAQATLAHAKKRIADLRLHVFGGKTHNDEMPLFYNAADCLLVASDYEGSPMVVKEALACNLPIVSVDVGDVVERLAGVTPSAIAARNPAALGNALVEIVSLGCRSNGREMMRDLSEEAVAGKIVSIYRLVAGADAKKPRDGQFEHLPPWPRPTASKRAA
jgi:glycosyltransferase involved in cell wall biosynthesis